MRRRALTAGLILLLCALAMSQALRERIGYLMDSGVQAVGAFSGQKEEKIDVTLAQMEVYALQLGVYDDAQRALDEQERLVSQGVPCVIWQRDKMRLICDVSSSRESLDLQSAGGNEAYVVRDVLERMELRVSGAQKDAQQAARFVALPDEILNELLEKENTVVEVIEKIRLLSAQALGMRTEIALYHELARSLIGWCDMIGQYDDASAARNYGAVAMSTIAREWRNALMNQSASAESAASAQRTPSTAADVIPPA